MGYKMSPEEMQAAAVQINRLKLFHPQYEAIEDAHECIMDLSPECLDDPNDSLLVFFYHWHFDEHQSDTQTMNYAIRCLAEVTGLVNITKKETHEPV